MVNGGSPIYVMPLIFGGAPVVNTIVAMYMQKWSVKQGRCFMRVLILVIVGAVAVLVFSPTFRAVRSKIELLDLL